MRWSALWKESPCLPCAPRSRRKRPMRVQREIIRLLRPFVGKVKTLTLITALKFTQHEHIAKALRAKTYFANPYCAWEQRGINREHQWPHTQFRFPRALTSMPLTPRTDQIRLSALVEQSTRKTGYTEHRMRSSPHVRAIDPIHRNCTYELNSRELAEHPIGVRSCNIASTSHCPGVRDRHGVSAGWLLYCRLTPFLCFLWTPFLCIWNSRLADVGEILCDALDPIAIRSWL